MLSINISEKSEFVRDDIIPEEMTEKIAMQLVDALASRFGWAWTVVTREDANGAVLSEGEFVDGQWHDRTKMLTDEEWSEISESYAWKGLCERMYEYSLELVDEIVWEVRGDK